MSHPNHRSGPSRPTAGRRSRTHPPATQRRPAATRHRRARSTASDTCPLPLTVWRCGTAPVDIAVGWLTQVTEKIVGSFSAPSDLVVLLTDIPSVRSDNQPGSTPAGEQTAGERDLGPAVTIVENLDRHARVLHARSFADALWRTRLTAANGDPVLGEANLVIATLSPRQVLDRGVIESWAQLLRPGGVLAMLTHTDHDDGRLVDPIGPIVTAAQGADLLYLQHIVVLPTGPSEIAAAPGTGHATGGHHSPPDTDRRRCSRHRRVHTDLLVFLYTGAAAAASEPAGPR